MEYLKEFQAFAGRFSAAAEEKLTRVDGGTYNEFIRFYSKPWREKAKNDEEQRQIDILLEELQQAMESSALLSAPQGTVLHVDAVEIGVGPALTKLFGALEKCLFFGATGAAPDFWAILQQAGRGAPPATAVHSFDSEQGIAEDVIAGNEGDHDVPAQPTANDHHPGVSSFGPGNLLADAVNGLMRVQSGHGRCRAWARGLLGLQGEASVEMELRNAAATAAVVRAVDGVAVIQEMNLENGGGEGLSVTTSATNKTAGFEATGTDLSSHFGASESTPPESYHASSDPDAGGGASTSSAYGSTVLSASHLGTASNVDRNVADETSAPPEEVSPRPMPPHLLPLWLRPGSQGGSTLEEICRCLRDFQRRLDEKGLSVRPSLNHAWLDQESIAATTTYTWPGFPRERLRCYVRGAGLSATDGEYVPAAGIVDDDDDGVAENNSVVLVGPNGCRIVRQISWSNDDEPCVVDNESFAVAAPHSADEYPSTSSYMQQDSDSPTRIAGKPEDCIAPFVPCWCLEVPVLSRYRGTRRTAYYCQGDGALPPLRGWRTTDMTDVPAPVLVFGTHSGEGHFDGENVDSRVLVESGGERQAVAPFEPAHVAVGWDASAFDSVGYTSDATPRGISARITMVQTTEVKAAEMLSTMSGQGEHSSTAHSRFRPAQQARKRKRRRPLEFYRTARSVSFDSGSEVDGDNAILEDGRLQLRNVGVANVYSNEETFSVGSDAMRHDKGEDDSFVQTGVDNEGRGENNGSVQEDEDTANNYLTAFKAERWKVAEPRGELLLRTERTRQLLLQMAKKQASAFETRKRELLDQLAGASKVYEEVSQESVDVTVERVLSARPHLHDEMEKETAANRAVPSLEELVAEKAEEVRTRPLVKDERQDNGITSAGEGAGIGGGNVAAIDDDAGDPDHATSGRRVGMSPMYNTEVGWPWPMAWLSAPRAPPGAVDAANEFAQASELGIEFSRDAGISGDGNLATEDDDGIDTPPFSMEVAAVEAGEPDAAHIEYVLRITYREVRAQEDGDISLTKPRSARTSLERDIGDNFCASVRPTVPGDDAGANELAALAAASKGLVQRTRVLSKRLNSLCTLHARLMLELEQERRLSPLPERLAPAVDGGRGVEKEREGTTTKPPAFPDTFELGTLEENVLRVHRDKLTPRFKANSPMRKMSARIGSYLSGLVYFLGVLEATGHASLRARLSRTLNQALATCDRDGRKRRRGDLILAVRTADDPNGKLASWVDDGARLRIQNRRCMGCGRAIAAEYLGMKKDCSPCRFANGLFCRSNCHNEGRRIIPHRVVHHWDFALHRVCNSAAAFLDATRFLPLVDLPEESPRLFVDQQALRVVRSRRAQLYLLRRVIVVQTGGKCAAGARVLEKLLHGRMHLAVDPGLYSVEDLVGVKKGTLVDVLEQALEALHQHVLAECDTCEAAGAKTCSACGSGDKVYPFQTATVARCNSCDRVFHAKCVAGSKGKGAAQALGSGPPKWWVDLLEGGKSFVCPKCDADAPMPAAWGD